MSISTVVVGTPYAGTSAMFSVLDILASVGRDWAILHGVEPPQPAFAASLRTIDGAPYWDINGRKITPDAVLSEEPGPDVVIVPDLHLDPAGEIPRDLAPLTEWIAEAHAGGAIVASICSGAMLLAAAGLLDACEATTHWGYADMLARNFPQVRVCRERILVPAGDGHRVITAGGASAWEDLALYLIARLVGPQDARQIAKIYLIEPHGDGQLCFASLVAGRQHDDKVIADAQVWAATHYHLANPVAEMAKRSGLSERSFLRRFRSATGQSPAEYVQTLRIEEAKQMLEAEDTPIERIAAEVGYTEPSSLRQAFRKQVGITASAYRKKWKGAFRV